MKVLLVSIGCFAVFCYKITEIWNRFDVHLMNAAEYSVKI
ncbi:hypothetical protein NMH_0307 [Neisseria meningitidis H44/76]|uniref:Uncharacterized protein n=5 Tax=Neisseria meningitidis TaxID=487 RepID=A0A0H5Q8N9_NEIMI|nr:hypothetical protein N875_06995 [Neisseria meningitidis LNP21362]EFM03343.1 hypothetical protein HMPREF0602_2183 [Neisseria meningitidis ATCC 13091]EFV64877.1 hypothetical protein NMH_0307 [Neisseria meningitidis H44/76]EOC79315.1 hypothetical protein NM51_2075 [Neisseria meningitidis NM51]KID53129.1 hypothetical protein N872_07840 [Neisseria meningitidis LNP27256]CBA09132.1 hypothetical protein predicted by Glimmer/Critica [Neisseria meningitidis alpha153]CCA43644.1 hypothetical protein N